MTAPLIFLDTETTGLDRATDEVWDFAAIRREPNGVTRTWELLVKHDVAKAERLPESFRADHARRYNPHQAVSPATFADVLGAVFAVPDGTSYRDRPHVVGACPDFDLAHLERILRENDRPVPWHHHIMDAETLAVGWLRGRREAKLRFGIMDPRDDDYEPFPGPPWDSDALSKAVGVDPGQFERHTALGDVRWAQAIHDVVMGEPS